MAYEGRFVDRNPELDAAGRVIARNYGAGDALESYPMEEAAEYAVKSKCKTTLEDIAPAPRTPALPPDNQLKNLLETELKKSRFVTFREKFSEDMYFKKPELGKPLQLNAKPAHVTNENTLFGRPVNYSESVYDIVLPKKKRTQVNHEYYKWHDKYIISHNHYFPSERINRHYDRKSFNPQTTFGKISAQDRTGRNVRRCLVDCDRLVVISKIQKEFNDRTVGYLGRPIIKQKYPISKDTTFGIRTSSDFCDAQALMENVTTCSNRNELVEAIGHINKIRHALCARRDFYMYDLESALVQQDNERTGYLPLAKIVEVMKSLYIRLTEDRLLRAARHFKLTENEGQENERIHIEGFCKLLHMQHPLPPTGSLSIMPPEVHNKVTTYRLLCSDREKKPNELVESKKQREETMDNAKTTASDLISPDTPMRLGLLPSDFSKPRTKDVLRRIFKLLVTEKFDIIWARAQAKLNTECISVDQLREEMETYNKEKSKPIFID